MLRVLRKQFRLTRKPSRRRRCGATLNLTDSILSPMYDPNNQLRESKRTSWVRVYYACIHLFFIFDPRFEFVYYYYSFRRDQLHTNSALDEFRT